MEYEKIKQLMNDFGDSKLSSIDVEFPDGTKLKMEKNDEKQIVVEKQTVENVPIVPQVVMENKVVDEIKEEGKIVKSPMVGTFYTKPSPDSVPYVEVGTRVKKGTVLCIIEAMKLMNEIESEFDGEIVEVLIKDGESVDYGKPLFRIV